MNDPRARTTRLGYSGAVEQQVRLPDIQASDRGRVDLPTGTVYPAMHRLERAGLVQASWSAAGGRRRRVYRLTPAGRRALDTERGTWRDFSAAVTALLQPAPLPATSP